MNEEWLRNTIRKLISEKEETKPRGRKGETGSRVYYVQGAVGRGRVSDQIQSMKALAKSDPRNLMKNLGISSPSGNSDLDILESIFNQAFGSDDTMKSVYSVAGSGKVLDRSGKSVDGLTIDVSIIPGRDGLKYVLHTLMGAEKAFGINFDGDVEINRKDNKIVVYSQ
jgi:hypothetical protein